MRIAEGNAFERSSGQSGDMESGVNPLFHPTSIVRTISQPSRKIKARLNLRTGRTLSITRFFSICFFLSHGRPPAR
jgi:hypothetical protein